MDSYIFTYNSKDFYVPIHQSTIALCCHFGLNKYIDRFNFDADVHLNGYATGIDGFDAGGGSFGWVRRATAGQSGGGFWSFFWVGFGWPSTNHAGGCRFGSLGSLAG